MHQCTKTISSNMFTIAAIATLPVELDALTASFDFVFGTGWLPSADIVLRFGRVGQHNVVAACLIQGGYGSSSAGAVVTDIKRLFPLVANMAMVGVGSALSKTSPEGEAVHLGDVVWSTPHGRGSVTEYDLSGVQVTNEGKTVQGEAKEVGNLSPAGRWWLGIASQMNATRLMSGSPLVQVGTDIIDKLTSGAVASPFDFKRPATGEDGRRARTRDAIQMEHTGSIACARTHLRRNARFRDYLHEQTGHLCLESAAAGLASAEIPYMVIRAICDYNDEHATEVWQPYAAAFAAASFKCFLLTGTATEALSQKLKATAIPIVPGPDLGRVDKKYVADFKYEGPAESKLVGEAGHRLNGGGGCGASSKSAAMDVSSDDQQQTSPVAVASSDRRRPGVVDPKRSAALAALDSRLPAAKKPRLEETAGGAGDGESKTASKADSKRVAVDVKVQAPSGPGGPVVLEEEIRNLCQQEERGADADSVAEATIARLLKALQIRDHMDSVDIPATVIRQVAERMARVIRVSEAATEIKSSKAA
jgi:nucleoside phosphorylase